MVKEGQFALIDCYLPHEYSTEKHCEFLWMHFDGYNARTYYRTILDKLDHVFSIPEPYRVLNRFSKLYDCFSKKFQVNELEMNRYLTDILTELAMQKSKSSQLAAYDEVAEKTMTYVSAHLADNLTVDLLANQVSLSVYHFIRIFKKGTGYTPHEYITHARINTAKFMLSNTEIPIKNICYSCGFSSESTFSTAFKKHTGQTPHSYRTHPE